MSTRSYECIQCRNQYIQIYFILDKHAKTLRLSFFVKAELVYK